MLKDLNIKIYADGADLKSMLEEYRKGMVKGFTTNPSLMKAAGVKNYKEFAKEVLGEIKDMPISFEVFSDEENGMIAEAKEIASWGENVYIKIPVVNTKGIFTGNVIKETVKNGGKVNVTAVFTIDQVKDILGCLDKKVPAIISVFAGRIADTGVNPSKLIRETLELCKEYKNVEILWASCREVYNIFEADEVGCHIITVQNSLLNKEKLIGKDLLGYSIETVNDFFKDATSLGFSIL